MYRGDSLKQLTVVPPRYLHFKLPSTSIGALPEIFSILELAKSTFDLEDYELTQTSLEAIFCKFAQAQYDNDDPVEPKTAPNVC